MITVAGFHIEPTNICTLKCSGCARTRFIQQWPQHWKNHSLDIDDLMRFIDIDISGMLMNLCGTYGDPIYHPDLPNMISRFKSRGARISVTTNGSYKTRDWWEKLTSFLDSNDTIRFSIDGTPDNFIRYRENANWASIKTGIEVCVDSPVKVTWKYIPFDFNQYDIDHVQTLALDMGVDSFLVDPSDRYDSQTQHLLPIEELVGSRKPAHDRIKNNLTVPVFPKCHAGREHFVAATGHYISCCYVADHRFYYKTQFGKNKTAYDISKVKFSELMGSNDVVKFYHDIDRDPPKVCQFNCPKT